MEEEHSRLRDRVKVLRQGEAGEFKKQSQWWGGMSGFQQRWRDLGWVDGTGARELGWR